MGGMFAQPELEQPAVVRLGWRSAAVLSLKRGSSGHCGQPTACESRAKSRSEPAPIASEVCSPPAEHAVRPEGRVLGATLSQGCPR